MSGNRGKKVDFGIVDGCLKGVRGGIEHTL